GGTLTLANGGDYTLTTTGTLTNAQIVVPNGVTATLRVPGNLTIDDYANEKSPIVLQGNAKLTLIVDGTLKVYGGAGKEKGKQYAANSAGFAGINVPVGTTLTVRGSGKLYAYGGDASPGSEAYFWAVYDNTVGSKREIGGGSGGGGAGAGIGGNGGAGGKGGGIIELNEISSKCGDDGGAGVSAGTVHIYDTVNVYVYGGGGASGGRGGNGVYGDAGGGGGYPAAGVGGGGAGGGGGSNGAGGGGFSGGGAEAYFNDTTGGWQQYEPGGINGNIPTGGDRNQDRGSGGAYYSNGTLSTSTTAASDTFPKRAYIGGGFGAWMVNQYNGGSGGTAGSGGTVYQANTAKLYAYNGSTTTTVAKQWGVNQTPIYWQNGHSLAAGRKTATTKAQMESGSYYNASRVLSYQNPANSNSRLGIGSGAGYTEISNGSFTIQKVPERVDSATLYMGITEYFRQRGR
ncbi:MAG: hypothetical protein HFI72_07270, partial [Peptococcaceae bacterium]|nr:hypothetical protein [Peptococcaceae bacterium]